MLHLAHPVILHFALAFLVAGGLSESIGILWRRTGAERLGGALVLAGTVCLVPTLATGWLAANSVDLPDTAAALLDRHETFAIVLLGVFLVLALWKAWGRGAIPERWRRAYAIALLVAVALTIATGLLGGQLVYGNGVGVAR